MLNFLKRIIGYFRAEQDISQTHLLDRLFFWRKRLSPPESPAPEPPASIALPDVAKIYAAGLVPPPAQQATAAIATVPQPSRHQRRAKDSQRRKFERARMKFDKFVEPKGEIPTKQPRAPQTEPTTPSAPRCKDVTITDDGNELIIGGHHFDHNTDVAYYGDEMYGEFNFRDTILDQLERYFVYLDRMQKRDPGAYGFYRNVGAILMPYLATPDVWLKEWHPQHKHGTKMDKLSAWFLQTRPTFGCIAYGTSPEAEKKEREGGRLKGKEIKRWIPRFMYFVKYSEPPYDWQPMSGGDVYSMTVYWDKTDEDKHLKGGGSPEQYGVFISKDGEMCVLKQLNTKWQKIRAKQRKDGQRGHIFNIPQRAWCIPNELEHWAKTHGSTAQVFLCNIFVSLAFEVERSAWSMVKVSVEKDDRHAMFGVDVMRMAYFFQDRDIELTESGRRKPIFHLVRPHLHKDGHARKLRFQGARDFTWAGYNVKIRVPGRDHAMIEEIDLGMHDSYWQQKDQKYYPETEVARMMRESIDTGTVDKSKAKKEVIE
jgi:hypothetical protein